MTYGPPPEPNAYPGPAQPQPGQPRPQQAGPGHPEAAAPNYPHTAAPNYPHAAGPNQAQQQPGSDYPQHLWPAHAQRPAPGSAPGAEPSKGSGLLAVASLILGLAGLVAPILPIAMDGFRQYAAFPFALPGVVLGIAGLTGRRRAQPLAAIGALVSVVALAIGAYMVFAYNLGL